MGQPLDIAVTIETPEGDPGLMLTEIATPLATQVALFGQAGVIATTSLGELVDTAALLACQPLPAGNRIAIVSNAGGAGVLPADGRPG